MAAGGTEMVQAKEQVSKDRRFVQNEVAMVAARLSENFTQQVTDEEAIWREVKRQMGTWGKRELTRVFWGTGEEQMYSVMSSWRPEDSLISPRRFIRFTAQRLLYNEVLRLLKDRGLFQS